MVRALYRMTSLENLFKSSLFSARLVCLNFRTFENLSLNLADDVGVIIHNQPQALKFESFGNF
jgi:hypothetical protein